MGCCRRGVGDVGACGCGDGPGAYGVRVGLSFTQPLPGRGRCFGGGVGCGDGAASTHLPAVSELGWFAMFPDELLSLLERVAGGEEPQAVLTELVMGAEYLDKEADDGV